MWITSYEQGSHFDPVQVQTSSQSLASPTKTHTAQHHYANAKPERRVSQDGYISEEETDAALARSAERGIFGGAKVPERGRKWDHARVDEPTIIHSGVTGERMSWITKLVRSSMYGPMENEDRHQVDYEFLNSLTPGYQKPWRGDAEKDIELGLLHSKKRRKLWYQRVQVGFAWISYSDLHTDILQQILLMHPLVPLGFRLIVLATSVIALGLSATIYSLDNGSKFSQAPSTIMAIIVDVIAMPYICYITWDEYTGKPLGLRSPRAKMRLVLLDLFFIIFESANAAIAFAAISDPHGACVAGDSGTNGFTCRRVKALAGFLLVALIAWSMTFTVSIFRYVLQSFSFPDKSTDNSTGWLNV